MYVYDYESGNCLRRASKKEENLSKEAAKKDGGAGVIELDGRRVYVV